ncbi:MAG: MFS transporter [Bdellovibrionaceae bacterium]|nr:MFS transporter [Pseudobdellovibrionaceae bacterium]
MKSRVLLAVAFLAFVSLGLPDTLLGIAWPFVREHFGLPHPFMGFVLIVTSFGYFISSSGVAGLMRRMPIGVLLAYSSGLVALGEFGFALSPAWIIFIGSGVLHGLGSGAIDAGLNHFAAVRFSARQINWLHASYSLGATAGPAIMTTAIVAAGSWRTGYGIVGGLLAALAFLFFATSSRWSESPTVNSEASSATAATAIDWKSALASPQARLQIALFFFYAGIEVGVGQWSFTLLTASRGLSVADAGSWVTLYWASIFGGRVVSGFVVERIGIDRLLRICFCTLIAGAILLALPALGWISLCALPMIGLSLAPVYPCLMSRTPSRVGVATSAHTVGFQVSAAMIGASALPTLIGLLAGSYGLEIVGVAIAGFSVVVFVIHEALLRPPR